MKRSELKEAIKAEIKSVLTEEIQVGDIVTLGGDGDELEVIDSREMFGSDMMAYRVKFPDGNTEEYSANQLRPARMMNEVYQTNSKMSQMVSLFQDMMADEYDGITVPDAFDDFMPKFLEAINKDYESAENFGEKVSNIGEAEYADRVGKSRLASNKYKQADEFNKSYDSMAQATAEKQFDDDIMDKAASKKAKQEKVGKQASKLSQADEDRYERIKNGLENLKKKGDEESIKKMKAILGKKEVEELIKAKGRTKASFM